MTGYNIQLLLSAIHEAPSSLNATAEGYLKSFSETIDALTTFNYIKKGLLDLCICSLQKVPPTGTTLLSSKSY